MNHNVEGNKARFLEKLREALGIISAACQATGVSRQTYYNWCKRDPKFAEECAECIEERIDFAEAALVNSIKAGVPASIIFFLKTKAKARGYVERMEWTGPNGGPVQAAISLDMLKEELPPDSLEEIARQLTLKQPREFQGKVATRIRKRAKA